eukprot:g3089.t2
MGRTYHKLAVGRESFEIDTRYSNLKPIGDGSYGFVCSAEDSADSTFFFVETRGGFNCSLVPVGIFSGDVYIVTNLMESDMDRIIASGQPLTDQHFQYFIYQVLRGLKFIHSANVLHRDMKPSNLLVNANCDLAICDFGLARGVELEYEDELTEYVVTRWYRAPELLCDSTHYGKTVDVWSVGCIFAEMLSRRPFFQGHNPHHQLETIVSVLGLPPEEQLSFVTHPAARKAIMSRANVKPKDLQSYFPADASPLALDLLRRMLVFHPEHRITVDEALEHAYLADLHGQMEEPTCRQRFDFEYERVFGSGNIPKEELQKIMFDDMQHLVSRHDPTADVQKGIESLGLEDKGDGGKEEPVVKPQDASDRK